MKTTTRVFKALAHNTRLQILSLLLDGEICVCQIMSILDLPQSTASRHLGILKNAGLVKDRKEGTWSHYSMTSGEDEITDDLLDLLKKHLARTREGQRNRRMLAAALSKKDCA